MLYHVISVILRKRLRAGKRLLLSWEFGHWPDFPNIFGHQRLAPELIHPIYTVGFAWQL